MAKIQKINNNIHIGSGTTSVPHFVGEVSSLITGEDYITSEEDKMIRPGYGTPLQVVQIAMLEEQMAIHMPLGEMNYFDIMN